LPNPWVNAWPFTKLVAIVFPAEETPWLNIFAKFYPI
jgi:hypothetical protein